MFAGRGLEDRLAGLVDDVSGDCDFLYFLVRRYLIHDVGHDALYNRPETSCSGVALNGELRDRPDRAVVELKVSAVHSDELLVLLDERVLRFGENPDESRFIEAVERDDDRKTTYELRNETVLDDIMRGDVLEETLLQLLFLRLYLACEPDDLAALSLRHLAEERSRLCPQGY